MELSIVIVNYNVRYFLEQCLLSLENSIQQLKCEVFVVDNNSIDGSVEMVKEKFPWVKLIESKENLGFSKGNNLAIKQAVGKYILLLNPDTVLEEQTLIKTVDFMENHNDAGGLGVKMINGKGEFLPESKRGLPTPKVAFYKIFGLSKLFPKSKKFGAYHLTYLDKDENHSVDVLAGAFMLLRKSVLDEIGLLDETFFMYGEDIDLSYRITKAGYKNYYCSDTKIIHYKGESTKKSSINYVIVFYKAMQIFAKKHFLSNQANTLTLLINLAIYLRAGLSIIKRLFNSLILPFLDFIFIIIGLFVIKEIYQDYTGIIYPKKIVNYSLLAYSFIWIAAIFFTGGYDKPLKIKLNITGTLYGTISILTLYSLLSEEYRFSRALIIFGSIYTVITTCLIRAVLDLLKINGFRLEKSIKKKIGVVSSDEEFKRIKELLLNQTEISNIVHIPIIKDNNELAQIITDNIDVFGINEIIFSGNDNSSQEIIDNMYFFSEKNISFKIVPKLQSFIIGSDSIETTGDIYNALQNSNISKDKNKRDKRISDFLISMIFILFYPILFIFYKNKLHLFTNLIQVFIGSKTFVGYKKGKLNPLLPKIKLGILPPPTYQQKEKINSDEVNLNYARNHNYLIDIKQIITNLRLLDSVD